MRRMVTDSCHCRHTYHTYTRDTYVNVDAYVSTETAIIPQRTPEQQSKTADATSPDKTSKS